MKKTFLIVLLAVFLGGLFPQAAFSSSPGAAMVGSVAGEVVDEGGRAAAGVRVQLFSCADDVLVAEVETGPDGGYLLSPVDNGCYLVRFSGAGYESSWYGEPPIRDAAVRIAVDGDAATGIDAEVSTASSAISGRVRTEKGEPLAAAWVTAIRLEEDSLSVSDERTGADGTFAIGVTPGPYVVVFSRSGYVTKIHGKSLTEPDLVEALADETLTGIDSVMEPGGRIAGIVTDGKGEGIAGIEVGVFGDGFPVGDLTDAAGRFLLDGLPAGDHQLIFVDPEQRYQTQWYDGSADPGQAKTVPVKVASTTPGVKAVMQAAGGISGWVTDAAGNGIPAVRVFAQGSGGATGFGTAVTGETGEYHLSGLASGPYLLFFQPTDPAYLPSFFPGTSDRENALPVAVTAPEVNYGVDQVLSRGVALSGRVLTPDGDPIPGVFVTAHSPSDDDPQVPGFAVSQADGTFLLGLPAGEYLLEFRGRDGFLSRWSGGAADRSGAEPIVVDPEAPVEIAMVLPRGAVLSGKVSNRVGAPLAGVRVRATETRTGEWRGSAVTAEDGSYRIEGLAAGAYGVVATGHDVGYVREHYPKAVSVTPPEEAAGVDFVMTRGGAIEGRATDAGGGPLQGVDVEVYDPATWKEIADVETDEQGAYWVGGLPVGSYAVRFEKSGFTVQWYSDKARRKDAVQVSLSGTATVAGVDAVLRQGVPLTGQVQSASGVALASAEVGIYGSVEDEPVDEVHTGFDGRFSFDNLAPGSYRLRFGHPDHIPQWHGGGHRHEATPIVIGSAQAPQLTASLAMSGVRVAGKLRNTDGEDVGEAWMTVIDGATGRPVADERICECSGKFDIPLHPGRYKLKVERQGQVYWYGEDETGQAETLVVDGNVSGLEMVIGGGP